MPWCSSFPPRHGPLVSIRMDAPKRVLIAPDFEASGIWRIGPGMHCAVHLSDMLDGQLVSDLKCWNDSADSLFGGRVGARQRDEKAQAAFHGKARDLAFRVQCQLGDDWEVLWNNPEPGWCWSWVQRPTAWQGG